MQQRELSPSELESMVPEGEVESRIDAVRAIMEERNLDAVVITSNNNVAYLSNLLTKGGGFKAVVLTRSGQATLFVIRMESGNAHFTVPASAGYEIIPFTSPAPARLVAEHLATTVKSGRVGYEPGSLTHGIPEQLTDVPGVEFVDIGGAVDSLRKIKSPHEIGLMRKAAEYTDIMSEAGVAAVKAGATEADVAEAFTSAGMRAGSGFMSGMPNVRSGWRTGMVNTGWSMKVIQPGDHAYLEFAGVAGRYHAPVWRTVLVGDVSDEVSRRADCNDAAMTLALDMLAPGVTGAQVYDAMAEVFEEYGQREFIHPLFGYSVGIGLLGSWGEPYYLGPSNDAPLQENMVIHHGSYMLSPRHWGMAVSQTILITADGCESLTKTDFKAIRA